MVLLYHVPGGRTSLPDFTEDLGRVQHAGHPVVLWLNSGSLEVHHIELQLCPQLGVCELQRDHMLMMPCELSSKCGRHPNVPMLHAVKSRITRSLLVSMSTLTAGPVEIQNAAAGADRTALCTMLMPTAMYASRSVII